MTKFFWCVRAQIKIFSNFFHIPEWIPGCHHCNSRKIYQKICILILDLFFSFCATLFPPLISGLCISKIWQILKCFILGHFIINKNLLFMKSVYYSYNISTDVLLLMISQIKTSLFGAATVGMRKMDTAVRSIRMGLRDALLLCYSKIIETWVFLAPTEKLILLSDFGATEDAYAYSTPYWWKMAHGYNWIKNT